MLKFKKHDNGKEKSDSKKESSHRSRSRSRSRSPKRSSRSRYSRSPSPRRRSRYSRSPSPKRSSRRSPSPSRRHRRYSPSSRRRDDDRDSKRRSRSPPKSKPSESKGVKKVLKQQPTYSLIQVEVNDRLGKKVRVKCAPNDLVGDFKKLVAAQIGTEPNKIVLKKWYKEYKDHITLADYEIHDGMNLELYYR